jgi:hypothetical protein
MRVVPWAAGTPFWPDLPRDRSLQPVSLALPEFCSDKDSCRALRKAPPAGQTVEFEGVMFSFGDTHL